MTKLVKKFQGGGTADETYRASYSLPEIKVIDKQPEWFKYLNDYDKARLKSGQINTETAKSIAQERATGTSQYMQDVNKLSWIPNGAMAVAGGMSLIGNPVAADVLGNAVLATDIVEAADRKGIKQAIKENAPDLLLATIPFAGFSKKLVKKGINKLGYNISRIKKPTIKTDKKANRFRWFKEEVTPAVEGKPAQPARVYDSEIKDWKDIPDGMKVSEPYYEGHIEGEVPADTPQYVDIIAPDGSVYGTYLKSAYKSPIPEIKPTPATYEINYNKLIGIPTVGTGIVIGGIEAIKNINSKNSQQNNTTQKTSNPLPSRYYQKEANW